MLADLLRRFAGEPAPAALAPEDGRLALAALMVRLARADDHYAAAERGRIERMLAERYGLPAAGAATLRGEAEEAEAAAPDTVQFTRMVKAGVPFDERAGVMEALWRVALAEEITADERGFLRLVANLIGVPDQESGLARQRAERDRRG